MVVLWISGAADGRSAVRSLVPNRAPRKRSGTMDQSAACRLALTSAVFLTACAVVVTVASGPLAAQSPPRQAAAQRAPAKAEKQSQPAQAEQTIAVLVNDEPITGYEIQQRAAFLAINANVGEQDEGANPKRAGQRSSRTPSSTTSCGAHPPAQRKSQEEAQAVQRRVRDQAAEEHDRPAATEAAVPRLLPKFRKEAQEELIEERLKLQEAKRSASRSPTTRSSA